MVWYRKSTKMPRKSMNRVCPIQLHSNKLPPIGGLKVSEVRLSKLNGLFEANKHQGSICLQCCNQ